MKGYGVTSAVIRAPVVGALAAALFLLLSWVSLAVPKETIAARIVAHAEDTLLTPSSWMILGHRGLPRYAGNDCLILGSMVLPYPGAVEEAVSPRMLLSTPGVVGRAGEGETPTCRAVVEHVAGLYADEAETGYYHRYVAAFRPAMRLLVGALPIPAGALLLLAVNLGLLALTGLGALRGALADGDAAERRRHRAFALIAAVFLLGYGLPVFGLWPSYALADAVVFAFLAAAWRWPLCALPEERFLALVAGFGALTAGFEFLTGGVPLGFALVLGAVALGRPADGRTLLRRAAQGTLAFGLAVAACFLVHYLAVAAVFGSATVADIVGAMGNRVGSGFLAEVGKAELEKAAALGIDLALVERSRILTMLYALAKFAYMSRVLAWGSMPLGAGTIGLGLAVLAWTLGRGLRRADADERVLRATLAASLLVLPAWYLVFLNHAVLHALWMVRPLAWAPALAGVMIFARPGYASAEDPYTLPLSATTSRTF